MLAWGSVEFRVEGLHKICGNPGFVGTDRMDKLGPKPEKDMHGSICRSGNGNGNFLLFGFRV